MIYGLNIDSIYMFILKSAKHVLLPTNHKCQCPFYMKCVRRVREKSIPLCAQHTNTQLKLTTHTAMSKLDFRTLALFLVEIISRYSAILALKET